MTRPAATPYRPEMHRRLWHTLCRERCRRPWRVPSVNATIDRSEAAA